MGYWLVGAMGGYVLTSLFFLKFPHLLHTPKKQRFRAVHISHRGGAGERYENTMEAFRHAAAVGTDMLELDCHITRDGHVIVSHDDQLDRISGLRVALSDLTLEQLPEILETLEVTFDKGKQHGGEPTSDIDGKAYTDDTALRKFAQLREVFEVFPDLPINIDIKVNNMLLIQKVSDLVREYNREHLTVWGNKDRTIVKQCYSVNPNIATIFSVKSVLWVVFLFYTGLLPFVPWREEFFEVPMLSIFKRMLPPRHTSRTKLLLVDFLDKILMRPALFAHLKRRGIQTYIWVLNDEEDFRRAFHVIRADGVMTDYPTRLSRYLEHHRPSWQPLSHSCQFYQSRGGATIDTSDEPIPNLTMTGRRGGNDSSSSSSNEMNNK